MDRVQTGIKGLDDMLHGGIPARRHVAIYGGPGTGKTSFGFEFLYRGALAGENGIYISLEETEDDIIENMRNTFPLFTEVDKLVKAKKLIVVKPDKLDLEEIIEKNLEKAVLDNDVKRGIIDSATMIKMSFAKEIEYRQTLFEALSLLRGLDCTTLMTVESTSPRKEALTYDIEHFVMDGIINLFSLERENTRVRALEIFKMRGTDHSRVLAPFKVMPSGIEVYPDEPVF